LPPAILQKTLLLSNTISSHAKNKGPGDFFRAAFEDWEKAPFARIIFLL
jgi:hypothetical protein